MAQRAETTVAECSLTSCVWVCFRDSLLVERRTRDRKVAGSNPMLEQRDHFLLQSQLCVLTLIRCPFHPRVTAVARKRPRSFCQKCRWQFASENAYTLDPAKQEWVDYAPLWEPINWSLVMMAFSSRARISGDCSTIYSPPALFFIAEISSPALILLFRPGSVHSGSASWDDCDRVFHDELRVSSFPDKVPALCLDSGVVGPLRLRWAKSVCTFRCNLPPALLAEWPGSFTCHCSNPDLEWTPNKSQHAKLTPEKKILPTLLPGFELATFWSRVRRSNQQAVPADH